MRRTLVLAAVVAASACVIRFGLGEGQPGQVAFDTYGYFYPNMLYALRSLAAGGRGLLWNPFQNCGQPFLAVTETGLFYPLNLFFLVTDPQREISLIWYGNRAGLEDRVFRIRTERSSATSVPEPRTGHNITNVEILEQRDSRCDVRFNWFTLYYRYQTVDPYFGTSFYTLDTTAARPLIKRRR